MNFNPTSPTKYRGTDQYLVPVVTRNYTPTVSDYRQPETGRNYVIGTIWQVGVNTTDGTYGDLYILSKIVANQGIWIPMVQNGSVVTQYAVLLGGADNTIVSLPPSATAGWALVSQGTGVNPKFGVLSVPGGGTGVATLTGVLTGNGTSAITASTVSNHGVVVAGASNSLSTVSPSSSGNVLTSNGTDWTSAPPPSGSGALTFIDQIVAVNGDESESFTDIGSYNTYMLVVRNCYSNSSNVGLRTLISIDGGLSYISTGYSSGLTFVPVGSTTWNQSSGTNAFLMGTDVNNASSPGINGIYYIFNAQGVEYTCFSGQATYSNSVGQALSFSSGSNTNVSPVTALKILFSSGTIFSGTFSLYGIVDS